MNLDRNQDRVGPDHKIRSDFRNFLLVYRPYDEGSALYALYDGGYAPAKKVAEELKPLVDTGYSIDYVYKFSNSDIARFMSYAENEAKIEKAREALKKACKLAFDAGLKHEEFQGFLVDCYEEISWKKDFVYRFGMDKEY